MSVQRYVLFQNVIYGANMLPVSDGEYVLYSDFEARCAGLETALHEAASSLETISASAGRDEYMEDMLQVRGYANSRATVARSALADTTNNDGDA